MAWRGVGLLFVVAMLVPATAGASHRPSACERLKGKDLAPHAKVKLVERANADDGKDLLGCVLPAGRVRRVASSADYYTSGENYSIRRIARTVLLMDSSSDSQYGSARSTWVYDIRTGRSYGIASSSYLLGEPASDPSDTTATTAFVNKAGQAVAAIVPDGTASLTIAGFSAKGKRADLDSGTPEELPAPSLGLNYSTAYWTHSGEPRSAELPG
ncbi:MAG TPA: hypothetical protein VF517_14145 [Thermoleophilaceae bacterium]